VPFNRASHCETVCVMSRRCRSENGKTGAHIPSTLARRALKHEFEVTSPTVASDLKDLSEDAAATSSAKQSARQNRRSSARHKKRSTVHRSLVCKRKKPSPLSGDHLLSGNCDNEQIGIRTRRMSATDAGDDQKSADFLATQNATVDNCSRLSSASTAPATAANLPAEVTGVF